MHLLQILVQLNFQMMFHMDIMVLVKDIVLQNNIKNKIILENKRWMYGALGVFYLNYFN